MREKGILIADKDTYLRRVLVGALKEAGYRVDTTESAADVLRVILKKNAHVILMGSDFDTEMGACDLIPLIRKCDHKLTIILISDENSLPMIRKIRCEGVFYHPLKPVNTGEQEEICQAVESAFKNVLNVLSIH